MKENVTSGSGAIAGIGVNQDGSEYNAAYAPSSFGEPGMKPKTAKRYNKKNKEEAKEWQRKITTTTT